MPVEYWFPTLVSCDDVDVPAAVEEAALAAIADARRRPGDPPHTLHLDPRLDPLFATLTPPIRRFLFEQLRLEEEGTEFYVGRCWPFVHPDDPDQDEHSGDASFSGVFFLEAPEGSARVEFLKPVLSSYDFLPKRELTGATYRSATYAGAKHRLLLFSSEIPHRFVVEAPVSGAQPIGVAFHLYGMVDVRGSSSGMPNAFSRRPIG